jgi:sugar phosphate isomerase/epimerase
MSNETMPLGVTAVMLPELDLDEQIALCHESHITHYSIRPRVVPDDQVGKAFSSHGNHKFDMTPRRLVKEGAAIGKKLRDAGLTPFGTLPVATTACGDDELKMHFEGSAAAGAGRVRVAPSPYPKGHFDYPAELRKQIDGFARAVEIAKPLKQKVVIETHSYSLAASPALSWNICRHFDPNDLGVIFDISNYQIEGALQPTLAVAVLDKYIDHVHLGGGYSVTAGYDANNFRQVGRVGAPVTEGNLYIPDWIAALRDAGRNVPIIVENFMCRDAGAHVVRHEAAALRRLLG